GRSGRRGGAAMKRGSEHQVPRFALIAPVKPCDDATAAPAIEHRPQARSCLRPRDDPVSYSGRRRTAAGGGTLTSVTGIEQFVRKYWLEVPLALLVLEGMVEVVVRRGDPDAPTSSLWFALPAFAALLVTLLSTRRFPFAGPAGYWLLATALTFVDGQLL